MSSIGMHLRVAAAGRAALHAEHRTEARLAHAEHGVDAEPPERLREADRHRALAFAGRRRIDRRDEHEPAARRPRRDLERQLRLVLPVQLDVVRPSVRDPRRRRRSVAASRCWRFRCRTERSAARISSVARSGWATKRQPNRPLMHRLPAVIALSSGEVAFTISPSCTCSVSVQPTPQYGQMVSVVVCARLVPVAGLAQLVLAARHQRARSGRRRCSCRSRRTPSPAARRRTRSRCARRSRGRRPQSRTCSGDPARTPRRTCSRARTCRSRGRRARCRS